MAKLIWTTPALRQLEEIIDYIALDKPLAAQRIVREIFAKTDHVERFKLLGRPIPEIAAPNYRQVWINPCWIYYKVSDSDIYILHVKRAETLFRVEDIQE